jgi:phage repressor protein C with HTH and peptisase S24 domain
MQLRHSRFGRVRISGPSMVPTLRSGDDVLVRYGAKITTGDVVVATYRSMPDRYVVKRTVRREDGGWVVASDNMFAGGDSATHGVADVVAKVILRLRPGIPRRVR